MKAVIFDLDRTLHDRDASLLAFLKTQHQSLNRGQGVPVSYIDRFIELECKGYVWKDKVYRALTSEFDLPLTSEELLQDYLAGFHRHCREVEGASSLLSFLKSEGYKVGMVTNGMTDVQNNTIDALGIRSHFDSIIISEEAGIKKPDPEIFELAARSLAVSPPECLYAGDHYQNDVLAARQAGMKTAWLLSGGEEIIDNKADVAVTSLADLRKYLSK